MKLSCMKLMTSLCRVNDEDDFFHELGIMFVAMLPGRSLLC